MNYACHSNRPLARIERETLIGVTFVVVSLLIVPIDVVFCVDAISDPKMTSVADRLSRQLNELVPIILGIELSDAEKQYEGLISNHE